MRVSVTRTEDTTGSPLTSVGPPCVLADDMLAHRVHLGSGVHLAVDLMAPCHWRGLTFLPSPGVAHPLLSRLLGTRAAADVSVRNVTVPAGGTVAVDTADATPWLRVAVVDALDRWLQLPLDQALLDAERGVCRVRAAAGLPDGPLRSGVVAESLELARQASRGLVGYLHGLPSEGVLAPALLAAMQSLVNGFGELIHEVGGDEELAAVLDAWCHLPGHTGERAGHLHAPAPAPVAHATGPGASTIDPRQSRARTFAVSPDPTSPEVSVVSGGRLDPGTVAVRAAAFGARVAPEMLSRLMVRLVDRGSGGLGGHALLSSTRRSARSGGSAILEARVPLCGLDPSGVRADLFDVLVAGPPAGDDTDPALRRARRAVAVLGEWRRLLGLARMPVPPAESAPLLREAVRRLGDGTADLDPDDPICNSAPSRQQLRHARSMDDEALLDWLRHGRPESERAAHDTGDLTVAELAAANAALTA